jgi:hypothetical protein
MTESNQAIACAYCDHRAPADLTDGWECPCGMARITTVRTSLKPFLDFSNLKSEGVGAFVNCTVTRHEPFDLARLPAGVYKFSLARVAENESAITFDQGERVTKAAKAMVAVQGMDWTELSVADIDYWKSLAIAALATFAS